MKVQITATTDGRYIGEVLEIETLDSIGNIMSHKDINFKITEKIINSDFITLACPNYVIKLKILDM
jgi:hypothetical protein